ncbi:MAG: hypothetical protein R2939_12055 [Kofleriaceae bacterium]
MQRIVVDAMGGDHAPQQIVAGAAEASLLLPDVEIILVGDAAVLGELLPGMRHDGARVRVHHAGTRIEMDDKPAEALAAKPDASIAVATPTWSPAAKTTRWCPPAAPAPRCSRCARAGR